MHERNESNGSDERNADPHPSRPPTGGSRPATRRATLTAMRRRAPDSDGEQRPELTVLDGGLSAEEAARAECRRRHPAATHRDGDGGDGPGPVAV